VNIPMYVKRKTKLANENIVKEIRFGSVSDSVDEYICLKCKATLIKDKKKNYP
jgi:hypothetical protein